MTQLALFDTTEAIPTVFIRPTKEMPLEVFRELYRISYFMELMERTPDGSVIWDESVTSIYSEQGAYIEYYALQNDIFYTRFELPKMLVDRLKANKNENA